jgi:hypothetical protein
VSSGRSLTLLGRVGQLLGGLGQLDLLLADRPVPRRRVVVVGVQLMHTRPFLMHPGPGLVHARASVGRVTGRAIAMLALEQRIVRERALLVRPGSLHQRIGQAGTAPRLSLALCRHGFGPALIGAGSIPGRRRALACRPLGLLGRRARGGAQFLVDDRALILGASTKLRRLGQGELGVDSPPDLAAPVRGACLQLSSGSPVLGGSRALLER